MRTVAANSNPSKKPAKTIGEVVSTRHFPVFLETDYVKVILPVLQESDLPAAGVVDWDNKLIGMLTERVILRSIFARSSDRTIHPSNIKKYLEDMQVSDVMIDEPETLDDTLSVEEAASIMLRRGYRFMPVVDKKSRHLLGIVSERELAAQLQDRLQQVSASERSYKEMLSHMLREPYGGGRYSFET